MAEAYDPLALPESSKTETIELIVHDETRQREIPLRVYLPATSRPEPIVLFSHGLGGTRKGCVYLGEHWSARGYVAVFLQHAGSDDSVWKSKPPSERMAAMRQAASLRNTLLRLKDVPAVLDQLEAWNDEAGHVLAGRLDKARVGMSGHSYGAVTTQGVSGQAARRGGQPFTDRRIRAAIAFSPSTPRGGDASVAFASVSIPWMLMTGTQDTSPIGSQTVESRLAVYPRLPATIDRYELVLYNAEHSAFTDRALPGDTQPRKANHHRAILSLSTAFWDAHLRGDADARVWLHGAGPRSILEESDRWQFEAGQ